MVYFSCIRLFVRVTFLAPSAKDIDLIVITLLLHSLLSLTLKITSEYRSKCVNKPTGFMLLRSLPWFRTQQNAIWVHVYIHMEAHYTFIHEVTRLLFIRWVGNSFWNWKLLNKAGKLVTYSRSLLFCTRRHIYSRLIWRSENVFLSQNCCYDRFYTMTVAMFSMQEGSRNCGFYFRHGLYCSVQLSGLP